MARDDQQDQSKHGVDDSLARHGGLSYLEIPASDAQQSAAFYEHVLGWKVDRPNAGQPKFSDRSGHLIGRWCAGRAPSREPGLMPYFYVDRIHDAVDVAKKRRIRES
jgi:predicted enzyme related to lactoylglutathione lyase